MSARKKPEAFKRLAGTQRADRAESEVIALPPVETLPPAPVWLPNQAAVDEWRRLTQLLSTNNLLTAASLQTLGHACAAHGRLVETWRAGKQPTGSMITQFRQLMRDLGLQGVQVAATPERKQNRFLRLKAGGRRGS